MARTSRTGQRSFLARYKKFSARFVVVGLVIGYFAYLSIFQINQIHSASAKSDDLTPVKYHAVATIATAKMVEGLHYDHPEIGNIESPDILDNYLRSLDPQKAFFLKSDIDDFRSKSNYYDDYLEDGDLREIFRVFERYQERVSDVTDYAVDLLEFDFNFGLSDELMSDRTEAFWPESEEEQKWLWKRFVKDDVLTLMLEGNEDAYATVLESRYDRRKKNVLQYKADDVTELFLNSYLRDLDPYSAYFSSNSTEDLEITLSQQIEGIGAVLVTEDDFTVVHSLITGGPAEQSNLIEIDDRIVGVSGEGDTFHDIIGWRLTNVVDLIRGPKGTAVKLKIIPKDALPGSVPEEITLIRDKVKIEEQMAQKSTVEIEQEGNLLQLGVISLPTFYASLYPNSSQDSVRSSAEDVSTLLEQLNDQQVDGILMDLRGNGGGALTEAVDLTGLFIDSGPVVQVKSTDGELEIKSDSTVGETVYDGPLVVLVDRRSASGSEIFAGAVQDYGRGIIVGETTFGKGMLQTIWPLDKVASTENAGTLKLSTAKFYRVNGISTHHLGVVPDIRFPTDEFTYDTGERSNENSKPGNAIAHVRNFAEWPRSNRVKQLVPTLSSRSEERARFHPVVNFLVERERNNRRRLEPTVVHLNKEKREELLESEREVDLQTLNNLRLSVGLSTVTELTDDAIPTDLIEDAYKDEALNILADLVVYQLGS